MNTELSEDFEQEIEAATPALQAILARIEALDAERVPHAEFQRCSKIATRIRRAITAMKRPDQPQAVPAQGVSRPTQH